MTTPAVSSSAVYTVQAGHLHRVMNGCEGSVRLAPINAREPPPSDAAREGIAAHSVLRQVLNENIDPVTFIGKNVRIDDDNGTYVVTRDIIENLRDTIDHIKNRWYLEALSSEFCERRTDWGTGTDRFKRWTDIRGRADYIAYSPETTTLFVDDLKYGWRLVSPEHNWTLISHAIGFAVSDNLPISRVVFTIHQPRPYHPDGPRRSWEITGDRLHQYKAEISDRFLTLSDTLRTGEHCYKCAAAPICPALRGATMTALDAVSVGYDDSLTDDELDYELDLMARAKALVEVRGKALMETATARIKGGNNLPNYSVQPIVGHRAWKPAISASVIETLTGITITKTETVTPAEAKRRGMSDELIAAFTDRPITGFKLTRESINDQASRLFGVKKGK